MTTRAICLWLVLMPTIIFIDIICFIIGIFSKEVRQLYITKFYNNTLNNQEKQWLQEESEG